MDNLIIILVAIIGSSALNTAVTFIVNRIDKKNNDGLQIKTAVRLVMKDRIKFLCEQYINQGWIYEDELDDLMIMHKSYHDDLNGNGFLDNLMSRCSGLTIKIR